MMTLAVLHEGTQFSHPSLVPDYRFLKTAPESALKGQCHEMVVEDKTMEW
jgi:hypothetical protein